MNDRKKLIHHRNLIISKIKWIRIKLNIDEITRMNTYEELKRIKYDLEQQILDTFKTEKEKMLYLSRIKR